VLGSPPLARRRRGRKVCYSASGQETEVDYCCSIPATLLLEPAPEFLPTSPLLDGDVVDA
ncbi:unnamed protein product, partial [Urochloa humidicola]